VREFEDWGAAEVVVVVRRRRWIGGRRRRKVLQSTMACVSALCGC
jgi:hypothetical protein